MVSTKMKASPRRRTQLENTSPGASDTSATVASSSPQNRRLRTTPTTTAKYGREMGASVPTGQTVSPLQDQNAEARAPRNFAHPAFAAIGKKLKSCNDTLSGMQLLGVQHVVELPGLVLVGDQSSGKSSLMSALARLNLPTSSGICTRCPFLIRTSSSKDTHWSCTVSLQQEYDYHPPSNHPIRQSDVTKKNPFPPWVPKPMAETKIFKTVYEQDSISIDDVLQWAQIATLNPSQSPQLFVPGEGSYAQETSIEAAKVATEARFSPNIISLELKGPGYMDLSFYDLPGIFAIAEVKGDDYLVDLVENLTRKYVHREETIIMLALPMDHDLDNSRTLKVIRDSNAEHRTIGIITKADKPNFNSPDTIAYWLAVLQGRKQTVGHQFFTTSLPPEKGLDDLQEWEESFFREGAGNWPREYDNFVHRCGVDQLGVYITDQLADAFTQCLPETKAKLGDRLREIECALKELPELPPNVEHAVRMSLRDFYTSVKRAVTEQDFEQDFKELNEQFYRLLVDMKPKCNLATDTPIFARPREQAIEISDDSSNETTSSKRPPPKDPTIYATPKKKKQRRVKELATPVKAESPTSLTFHSPATARHSSPLQDDLNHFSSCSRVGIGLSLVEIARDIRHKTRGGFGDVVPLEVHEQLCLRAVSKWKGPLEIYIEKATTMLMSTVTRALGASLGNLSRRLIFKESQEHLLAFLREQEALQRARLVETYDNETYKAVTINEQSMNHFKAKEKEILERHRLVSRAKAAGLLDDDRVFKNDEQMSQEEKTEEAKLLNKCLAQLPEDEYKREIDVAAKVRGYYLTAATRFVDSVSMDINTRLFRSFREGALDDYLDKQLGLFPYPAPSTYDRLMEEEETTAQKREQLKKEREKLVTALRDITELEGSSARYNIPRHDLQRPAAHAFEVEQLKSMTDDLEDFC
ncbi:P-loop containing nucleoside triphosphate hydrolase protein [Xylariaceae sp. FL1651]|nr:P-loop containing nucleoside triphosphate hydrolase protein [Xylariaceae sp. FL1651]